MGAILIKTTTNRYNISTRKIHTFGNLLQNFTTVVSENHSVYIGGFLAEKVDLILKFSYPNNIQAF